jgi:hypothetical protein
MNFNRDCARGDDYSSAGRGRARPLGCPSANDTVCTDQLDYLKVASTRLGTEQAGALVRRPC